MQLTPTQKKELIKRALTCKVCGKQMPSFYRGCVKTTNYNKDHTRAMYVCNQECKDNWENQYFVEEYNGNKIYLVDEYYIPYFGAAYGFATIEDCRKRIDTPNIAMAPFMAFSQEGLTECEIPPIYYEKSSFCSSDMVKDIFQHYIEWIEYDDVKIEICGVTTEAAIIVTALTMKGICPEAKVIVDSDYCIGHYKEMENYDYNIMNMCHIDVLGNKYIDTFHDLLQYVIDIYQPIKNKEVKNNE